MFYQPKDGHGLPHNPFNALIMPRPIGWISSVSKAGKINLAPYSFFNGVSYEPPQIMFSATGSHEFGGFKDTIQNIKETEEFVANMVSFDLLEVMNNTSIAAPHDVDEFDLYGIEKEESEMVAAPRVAASPVHLECKLVKIVDLPAKGEGASNTVVFGEVIGIHIKDEYLKDGLVDMPKLNPVARMGYRDFGVIGDYFTHTRPNWED